MQISSPLIRWSGLLLATVLLAGCAATQRTAAPPPAKTVTDFKIVEQSTPRELTPAEQAQIQIAVENFLSGRDEARSGVYEVRVAFTPEQPGQPGEWVVVRISRLVVQGYELVASHPLERRGYEYYHDQYGYGPWGGYFSDPLYSGYGYYYPSSRRPDRRPPPDDSRDHDRQSPPPRPDETPTVANRPPTTQVPPHRPPFEQRSRPVPDRSRDEHRPAPNSPFEGRGRSNGHQPTPRAEPTPRTEPPPAPPSPPLPPPERTMPERSVPEAPRETIKGDRRSRLE
jgi:hypothetical protein